LRNVTRDAALIEEDLLHRLGNTVAPDRGRPIARHEPDDDRPDDGHDDDGGTKVVVRGRSERRRPGAVEGDIGDEPDQRRQDPCGECGEDGHANRQG
jgi:hypothetical protein